MTVSESLAATWKLVLSEEPQAEGIYYRRLPVSSHWAIHAGIRRPADSLALILETEKEAAKKFSYQDDTKGYRIEVGPDPTSRPNRATIQIVETDPAFRGYFTKFCVDVIEQWHGQTDATAALISLSSHLAKWRRFFQAGGEDGLRREDYIGLFGELSFMEGALRAGMPAQRIVDAWHGHESEKTNQDFLFGTVAAEVKTTTSNEIDRIHVSNVRQLEVVGLQQLLLARYAFDFRQGSGVTLPQKVKALRALIAAASQEADYQFSERLFQAGYIDAHPHTLDQWGFTLRNFSSFEVREDFPRIREATLPLGVSGVKYELNLSAAEKYRIAEAFLWSTIGASHGRRS